MPKKLSVFRLGLVGALSLGCLFINAADKVDTSKLPPPSDKKDLTYDRDIKPMLEKSCAKCHGGDKPKGRYRMDTVETTIKGGTSGEPAVVAGHSEKSPMILYVAGLVQDMEMPPIDNRDKYPPLTKDQIGLLRAWIDQGAK